MAGICMLCAFAASAIAAQGASAVTGTTLFTCKEGTGTGTQFSKAHCKDADTSAGGKFGHFEVPENTTTHLTATSENTNAETNGPSTSTLKMTVGGIGVEMTTSSIHATGSIKNLKDPNGEHYLEGNEITVTFTNLTSPVCEIFTDSTPGVGEKGVIHTLPLKLTSTEQGDSVKITPENAEGEFFHFWLKNCGSPFLEGTYKAIGSLTCKPDGATITCNHEEITAQGTFRLNSKAGPKLGISGTLTVLGGEGTAAEGKPTNPLSVTTKTT